MQHSALAKRLWPPFAVAAIALYFYGLGSFPLIGPDEPRYAQVAREMYLRSDWVTPTLGGHTWFEKPVLLYWLMMASYRVFGVSETAARLGSACAGLLTILFIVICSARVERESANGDRSWLSFACGLVLSSSLGSLAFSRGASFDALLTFTVTFSLVCFLLSDLEERAGRKTLWLVCFYVGMGLSLLAKGLIGPVLVGGVIGVYFLLGRRLPRAHQMWSLLWGVPLTLAVASLWYGPVIHRHGWAFVDEFFIQHHFARYTSNKYHHPQPFYFYLLVIPLLALPWTGFLVKALARARKWEWKGTDALSRSRVFALAWLLWPLAFFSISGSKLPGYILPVLPAAAFLTGEQLSSFIRGERDGKNVMRATGVIFLLFALGGMFFATHSGLMSHGCAGLISAPLFVSGLIIFSRTNAKLLCALSVCAAVFLSIAMVLTCGLDKVGQRESVRDLLEQAQQQGYGAAPVYGLHTVQRTAEFYAAGRLAYDERGEPVKYEGAFQVEYAARRHSTGPILVFVPVEYRKQLTENSAVSTYLIADNGEVALLAVQTRPPALSPHLPKE